ncbi:MAG: DUF4412 domain-containing protein [Chlorobiaceae bacterium]|nr:DUF4412 domain-containing protein [Chlorobiaceae bacterium]
MKRSFNLFTALLFLILALPSVARAFTGEMQMSLTMPSGKANIAYLFGKKAQRMEMTMLMERIPEPLKTTVITRSAIPDEVTIVNHKSKTWSTMNLRAAAESATLLDFDSDYRFTRIGTETLKGYACEHVRLQSTSDRLDLWITKGLGDFSTFRLLQSQNPRLSNTSLSKSLKTNGIEGFPVKIIQSNDNGLYIMELTRVVPNEPADSNFSVPSGYQRTEPDRITIDSDQKKHLRQLMEKMKDFEQ